MANGFVQVPPDSSGKRVDCVSLSAGGQTVVRQTVVIADPTKSAGYAIVSGGQQLVKGAFTLGSGTNQIGYLQKISASVTVQGNVALNAGAAHIGEVNISLMPAVVLAAGAAHVGEVNISTMPAVNISAMPAVALAAGAAHIGEVNISVMPAVVLAAGAAHIGEVNISTMPQVSVLNVAGSAMIGAVSVGAIASITAPINISAMPAVVLAAGAAHVGEVNISIMPAVVLATGANTIGTLQGISTTVTTINAYRGVVLAIPSASHGPQTSVLNGSATATLVASAGAAAIFVDSLICTNGGAALSLVNILEKSLSAVVVQYLAANGGGFAHNFDPPWKISAGASLQAFLNSGGPVNITVNFHVA